MSHLQHRRSLLQSGAALGLLGGLGFAASALAAGKVKPSA